MFARLILSILIIWAITHSGCVPLMCHYLDNLDNKSKTKKAIPVQEEKADDTPAE